MRRLLFGLVLLCPLAAAGQPVQEVAAGFDRDANRYRWTADLNMARYIGPWDVRVTNRFASEALLLGSEILSFRDENRSRWQVTRALSGGLTLGTRGTADVFSQSHVLAFEALVLARVQPVPALVFEPAAGFALDQRPGIATATGALPMRRDSGPALGLRAAWLPEASSPWQGGVQGTAQWQRLDPRQHHTARVQGTAQGGVGDAAIQVEGGYANLRRDAYQAASFLNRQEDLERRETTVEATTSDTLWAQAAVALPVQVAALDAPVQVHVRLDALVNNRYIRTLRAPNKALFFDTDFNRRAVSVGADARYQQGRLLLSVGFDAEAGVERRTLANRTTLPASQAALKGDLLRQADVDAGRFTLRTEARLPIRAATLGLSTTSSILRHDTPDINDDDRDEVFHTARLQVTLPASRYLALDLTTFGSYYHTVYLRATRSAENDQRLSLRWQPALRWTPTPATRIRLATEVRATYTVADFEIAGRQANDQAARELRYDLAWQQTLAPTAVLHLDASYSDLRLGRLLWDTFAEIPTDTLRSYSGWVRMAVGRSWRAELGVRTYVRSDYQRAASVRYPRVDADGQPLVDAQGDPLLDSISRPGREWIVQVGPTTSLTLPLSGGSAVEFGGWLQLQRIFQTLYGTLPPANAGRIRRAAREGRTRLIPNLTVSLLWAL